MTLFHMQMIVLAPINQMPMTKALAFLKLTDLSSMLETLNEECEINSIKYKSGI